MVNLAKNFPKEGPIGITDKLLELYSITLDQSTVWRILTRTKTRYKTGYVTPLVESKLYALDAPGQDDVCYPFGKSRTIACFEAVDDCSRYLDGKCFEYEDAVSAIAFVSELVNRAPFRIQAIRVDNRYGKKLREFCATLGITVIENDPYSLTQNGKVERIHKTSKEHFFLPYTSFTDSLEEINYKYSPMASPLQLQETASGLQNGQTHARPKMLHLLPC